MSAPSRTSRALTATTSTATTLRAPDGSSCPSAAQGTGLPGIAKGTGLPGIAEGTGLAGTGANVAKGVDFASIGRTIGGWNFSPAFVANLGSLYKPSFDLSGLGTWAHAPAVSEIGRIIAEQTIKGAPLISPSWFDPIVGALRNSLLHLGFPDPDDLEPGALPANLAAADIDYDPDEWLLWIAEGLVVAEVPDPKTLELIASAADPAARRAAMTTRSDDVLDWCETLLDDLTAAELQRFIEPARRSIAGIRAGFDDLAQAYAASTLETMQLLLTGQGHYKSVKRDLGQAEIVREKLHLAQLEHAFRSYKDDVPTTFNRHGSSHGVGLGRQFSHLNAVLGAAHLVSAMRQHERSILDAHR